MKRIAIANSMMMEMYMCRMCMMMRAQKHDSLCSRSI